jgi:hypothetical protein
MSAYQNSDQAFIDEWDAAIDMYGEIFPGLTIVATTGSGLIDFVTGDSFPVPTDVSGERGRPDMDCAAEAAILSHFIDPLVDLLNAKSTQTSGLEAIRASNVNLGDVGVKFLSLETENYSFPSAQILGGFQFNTSVANNPSKQGNSPEVEQALFNVLQVVFTNTPVGSPYCEPQSGSPLNYLQIYYPDFQYAESNGNAPVTEGTCGSTSVSAQTELNTASEQLLGIAEP